MNPVDLIGKDMMGDGHVYPVDDLRPHEMIRRCWCKPVEDDESVIGNSIWVHNALDRRQQKGTNQ